VIISTHDFSGTPGEEELLARLSEIRAAGADVGKIVTTANSIKDCQRVLGLLPLAEKQNFPLIAFCMGGKGRFTRVAALLRGAPFMYASVSENEATAAGQFTVDGLRRALKSASR
jgi:3-dehydroquinate dehydratase type I